MCKKEKKKIKPWKNHKKIIFLKKLIEGNQYESKKTFLERKIFFSVNIVLKQLKNNLNFNFEQQH